MRTNTILLKVPATAVACFLFHIIFAQAGYDGNMLATYLGKPSESQEIKNFESAFHCDLSNPAHCVSATDGVELMMKEGALNEIRIYKNSSVYGQFKGNLPKGLKFDMSSSEVKSLLGKPKVSYNTTGYCEFDIQGVIYACGFDNGKFSELTLSRK